MKFYFKLYVLLSLMLPLAAQKEPKNDNSSLQDQLTLITQDIETSPDDSSNADELAAAQDLITRAGRGAFTTLNVADRIELGGSMVTQGNSRFVRNLDIGGNLTVVGNITINNTIINNQTITGNQTVNGNETINGTLTISSLGAGVMQTNASGVVSSSNGTDGQLLIGGGAAPAWANLTSTGGTVTITNGPNSINLEAAGASGFVTTLAADTGSATPAGGIITIAGGNSIATSAVGSTLTVNVDGTTNHAVQVGNTLGSISSLPTGTSGQLLQTGGAATDPQWTVSTYPTISAQGDLIYASAANTFITLSKNTNATRYLANTGASNGPNWDQINLSNGVTNTLGVANGGTGATTFTANSVLVGNNSSAVSATNAGTTGTVLTGVTGSAPSFSASPSVSGSITAGTGITATTGNIAASSGNVTASGLVSAGTSMSAGTTITAGTGITATTGNITASSGNITATTGSVSAGTTVTAGTGLTVTSGGINSTGTSTFTGNLNLALQSQLRLQDGSGSGRYVGLNAQANVPSSYTLSMPTTIPTAHQIMQANSVTPTNLEWITPGAAQLPTVSRTVYVAAFGNDITGDGSFTNPYASLSKAVDTANSISSSSAPVVIHMAPSVYVENNSAGPITITADGVSVVGDSSSSVIIVPADNTQDLLSATTTVQLTNLTFNSFGLTTTPSTAAGITLSGGTNTILLNILCFGFETGIVCQGGAANTYAFNSCLFIANQTGMNINNTIASCNNCIFQGTTTITEPPANTGVTITGSTATLIFNGGVFALCETATILSNSAVFTASAISYKLNIFDILAQTASTMTLTGCSFELTATTTDVDIHIKDAGTNVEMIGCEFNGLNSLGAPQGTGILITDSAQVNISACGMKNYVVGVQIGNSGTATDTSATALIASAFIINNCTTDLLQLGSTTLNFISGSASGSKISIADSTNVTLAFFDQEDNNALNIGSEANVATKLLHVAIGSATDPQLNYKPALYSTQAIGYENPSPQTDPATLFVLASDGANANLTAITSDRTKTAGVRLVSDTASPVGGTTALRGWDINKNSSTAELSFKYQNTDATGQAPVAQYTVMQLDGVNNQLQLPTAATQIVFASDTNLYRSAANTLKTDDNLIIDGLTASRAVATDGSKQLVSSVTTATELGFLSGVTSSVQTQLNNKLNTTGGTMTGALTLPAGTAASPSLNFTGSTTTGLSAQTVNQLSFDTSGVERMHITSAGTVTILDTANGFGTAGVVHNDASGNLSSSLIVNADVSNTAAITDGKLATITSSGKVANSATTATSANTASAIVARDASGNFSAGTITASLTGAASLNVLKAGDTMTGALQLPAGTTAAPSLNFTGSVTTGLSAASNALSLSTSALERINIGSSGLVTITGLNTAGVVHTNGSGTLSTSQVVNADIADATITNTKLATVSSANNANYIVARDGSGNFETNMITIDGTVTNPTDVATKAYVDSVAGLGLNVKAPAVVVSTTNVALSGLQTIDGVLLVDGDRVLLVGQTDPVENGLWVAHSGTWTRPADFSSGTAPIGLAYVLIQEGTVYAGSSWITTTPEAVVGTDPIEFTLFAQPVQTTGANVGAGAGQVFKNATGNVLNFRTLAAGAHMAIVTNTNDVTLATDATSANTPSTSVARDGSGDFAAGTITANLTGAASLNVLKTGDTMTGNLNMAAQTEVRLQDAAGGQYVGLNAPTTVPTSYTLSLPSTIPTANQIMQANSVTPTNLEWFTTGGAQPPSNSRIIYVATFGNDTTGSGSFNSPYASLAKAVDTANSISSTNNPVCIIIGPGIYVEDNSTGAITITAGGITVKGNSASATIIIPTTTSNPLLTVSSTIAEIDYLTFIVNGGTTPSAAACITLSSAGTTLLNNLQIFSFGTGLACQGTPTDNYTVANCLFSDNAIGIDVNDVILICTNCTLSGVATPFAPPTNIGLSATGASALISFSGGLVVQCDTGINLLNNSTINMFSTNFKLNNMGVVQTTSSTSLLSGCSFGFSTDPSNVYIQASGTGTTCSIIGSDLNGLSLLGAAQATGIITTDGAVTNVSSTNLQHFTLAAQVGASGTTTDTSSTTLIMSGTNLTNNTADVDQNGSTTFKLLSSSASSTKLTINDATNVSLAYFDLVDGNALKIGSTGNMNTHLLQAAISSATDNPQIDYISSLYSTQAIGYHNPTINPSTLFVNSTNDAHVTGVTTDRTKISGVRLVSDTASPVGGTTALRGWDIDKNASTAELSFKYQNTDITGQAPVAQYTVMQLDGVNNQLQLPTTATQIVFAADTNLYRSAANTLKTDDNLIIDGLTASRAVATDASKQLVSSVTTATELGFLSGVTSSVQTQLNNKASLSGATFTGPVTLPAGSAATPSLNFTGSTTTGLSAQTVNQLSFDTSGVERMRITAAGTVTILDTANGFGTAGVVHNDASGNLSSSLIVNADVSASAAIVDTKLATISSAGKVLNSATTATSANTASAIVARDTSGNFSAGTITASLTGAASLNVLKAGDTMTGALQVPAGSAAAPTLNFTGSPTTGLSAATTNTLSLDTNGVERMSIGATGTVTMGTGTGLNAVGVVQTSSAGVLSTSTGANGQVLIGGGTAPTWANITSTGGTVSITNGANSINLEASSATASSFPTDSGTATPSLGALQIFGSSNINTSGATNTVTITLNNSPSVSGSLTAGTSITATAGNIVASAGNINATSGSMSAGTTVTAGTGITATTGNIAASSGNVTASGLVSAGTAVSAGTTVTAGTGLTVTTGGAAITGTTTINGGTVNIGTDTADNVINIGTAASAGRTITIGNTIGTSSVVIASGTGGVSVGTSANAHATTVGSANTTSSTTLQSGSGALNVTSTNGPLTINSGTGTLAVSNDATATTVNFATGAGVKTTTLGSTNTTSTTTVQSGSGALNITATNGALTVNSGTGALGVSTDATATTVNFATGAGVKTTTLGSTNTTSTTTVQSGSGALNVTSTNGALTVNSGTGTLGISTDATANTINIGTGAGVKTTTLGSTNTTSTTTVQSGTGGISINSDGGTMSLATTNTALTANTGTGTINISTDASATTVNVATGAAVKTLNLGSATAGSVINTLANLVVQDLLIFNSPALQTAAAANGGTTNAAATTVVLVLIPAATIAGHTVVFPPNPTNGQVFTVMLGGAAGVNITTLTNTAGTGGATIVNPITSLQQATLNATTSAAATYLYTSANNRWNKFSRG